MGRSANARGSVGAFRRLVDGLKNLRVIPGRRPVPDDFDPVTGLLTSRPFMDKVKRTWPEQGVLLLVSSDTFDQAKSEQGRAQADEILVSIAGRIRDNVRDDDLMSRIGENLFAVYLVGAERIHALRIATRLARDVPTPNSPQLAVTLSIGGTESVSADNPNHMFEQAKAAMAHASPDYPRFFPRLVARDGRTVIEPI